MCHLHTSGLRLTSWQEGNSFFNGWTFFTEGDPTDGNVQYIDSGTAVRLTVCPVWSATLTSACSRRTT